MFGMLADTRMGLVKYARGWVVLVMLLLTWAVYGYMLSVSIPAVMNHAQGMKLLDMQPLGYSVEYAKELFAKLGETGRHMYLTRQIPADMVYPLLFALSYSLLLTYLFGKGFRPESRWQSLTIVPMFGGAFDYLENIGIIYHLQSFPQLSDNLIRLTNVCSIAKSVFTTLFFVLLAVGLVRIVQLRFTGSNK